MYFVYIVKCCDETLYTGIAKNICARIKQHYYKQDGCAKYTRSRGIKEVEAVWRCEDRRAASKLEYFIKKLKRSDKEKLIKCSGSLPALSGLENADQYRFINNINLKICLENDRV